MTLAALLEESAPDLRAWLRRHAGWILRFESEDDLLQGIHLRALEREADFEYRGREAFFAWMYALARTFLANRNAHWSALKRRPARLLRLTGSRTPRPGTPGAPEPAATAPGPSTFASRREQLTVAVKALAVLLPRDRDLVQWEADGVPPEEQARRRGLAPAAQRQARKRALDRFRKAYELASR